MVHYSSRRSLAINKFFVKIFLFFPKKIEKYQSVQKILNNINFFRKKFFKGKIFTSANFFRKYKKTSACTSALELFIPFIQG